MTLLQIFELIAAILWCYTGLTALAWANTARRAEQRMHIPMIADLLSHLVPAMILLVVIVLFGALFGLVSVVAFIAVIFPAGLAFGAHMALAEVTERPEMAAHWPRMGAALILGIAISIYRFSTQAAL